MAPKRTSIPLLCMLLAAACRPADPDAVTPEPDALYFESIGQGQRGLLTDTTEGVFRDSTAWAEWGRQLRPVTPFAEVDFSQSMVFVAALPQTSGGYRIQFESVEAGDSVIVASYTLFEPAGDCITTMALTLPFEAVAVRRAAGPVSFRRRIERVSCSPD